ncbi:PepSY domain-containing protein [Lentibacillus juripiscarius]|uniref:PepSY domain-containing protein n=1 Tax=Lentibacillus juripiscarius TaxID=257446 RepID=A0ABW5V4P6_9BACI
MNKKILLTLLSTFFFVIMMSPEIMASQSSEGFRPTINPGQPAPGFDPDDPYGMYIKADTEHYWKGRYSNGRVFSEYIANELAGDYDNLVNYAVGGAFTGVLTGTKGTIDARSNWSPWLKGWGGVQQTERFLLDVDGQADPKALYIISVGGNDSYAVEKLGAKRTAELSSDAALKMVQNLVGAGAKYILLPNRFVDKRTNLTSFRDMQNQMVVQKIEDYLALDTTPDDVEVIYGHDQRLHANIEKQGFKKFGYKSMGFYMISDWVPAYGYGLTSKDNSDIYPSNDAEDIYGGYSNYSTDSKYYQPETADWEPNDLYTYDEYHLSNRSQKHLATYLLNSDIKTNDGIFKKVYNGKESDFAKAIENGTIPSKYTKVYTFGESSIDSGRALEVTTNLVKKRDNGEKMPTKISELKTRTKSLVRKGEIEDEQSIHALNSHLIVLKHYRSVGKSQKVVKHLKSFKALLEHQTHNNQISKKAYLVLKSKADVLLSNFNQNAILTRSQNAMQTESEGAEDDENEVDEGEDTEDDENVDPSTVNISKKEAKEAALQKTSGKIVETELEKEDGTAAYEINIKTKNGTFYDVTVNAETGKVTDTEKEDA